MLQVFTLRRALFTGLQKWYRKYKLSYINNMPLDRDFPIRVYHKGFYLYINRTYFGIIMPSNRPTIFSDFLGVDL